MKLQKNMVGWFEIPVADMPRAVKFYEEVFDLKLELTQIGTLEMAWFPWSEGLPGAPGSLAKDSAYYHPSPNGVTVYFSSQGDNLEVELSRVEAAGGQVLMPKKLIGEGIGYMALFLDTEGNRIALHSLK